MKRVLLAIVVASCAQANAAHAQEGYYTGRGAFLPDSSLESYRNGAFVIRVRRDVSNAGDRALIERAESLYPSRDMIAREAAGATSTPFVERMTKAALLPGDRWWWDDAGWFLMPFAVTGTAVQHYTEHMRILAEKPDQRDALSRPAGLFSYSAHVVVNASQPLTREVRMELRVDLTCGARCGLHFTHTRTVTFDANGKVLTIKGDGIPTGIAN